MYKATVNDDSLKSRLTASATLHLLFFALLYFGLPHLMPPLPAHHDPVPFEIVTVAELTNTRIKDEQQPPAPPAPPPQPQAKPTPPPPPQPQVKQPPPPAPPQPKAEDVEALKPKPVEKKPIEKPVEKPAPPQPDLMSSVLKNVAKLKPADQAKPTDQKTDAKTPPAQAASNAPSLSNRLTISEEDLLRRQIEQNWTPPIGAKDAQNLVVELLIDVNQDKTVANVDIVDKGRYNTDPFFRAAADSARRAVMNPRSSPLQLPDGKYDQWKRIDMTFDPRDML